MDEIKLFLLGHGPDSISVFRPFIERFESVHNVHINTEIYDWEAAWPELVKASLHGKGPDVCETGSTWISSLIAKDALVPFSARELSTYGGASAFLPSVWLPGLEAGFGDVWALPWLAYTRLIYYRRDLFEKAGIDEQDAFQSQEQIERTLVTLEGKRGSHALVCAHPSQPGHAAQYCFVDLVSRWGFCQRRWQADPFQCPGSPRRHACLF